MDLKKRKTYTLYELPDDCFVNIFSYLPLENLLKNIAIVNKRFSHILNSQIPEKTWERIFLQNFGFQHPTNKPEIPLDHHKLCVERFSEFWLSKNHYPRDTLTSRIRVVAKETDEKVVNNEGDIDYTTFEDRLRKSQISLRVYSPTQEWEEITVEDLCRIRGEIAEPEIFEGVLKVLGSDGLIFQIAYEEGQVFMKPQSCANLVGFYNGAEVAAENEVDPEEEDEDGTENFPWLDDFFNILERALEYDHVKPLIKEFKLSPFDAEIFEMDDEIEEFNPELQADEIDQEELAELSTAHFVDGEENFRGDEEEEENEEEIEDEDREFIVRDNDDEDFLVRDGGGGEGGGGLIILDDDDEEDFVVRDEDEEEDDDDDDIQIVQTSVNIDINDEEEEEQEELQDEEQDEVLLVRTNVINEQDDDEDDGFVIPSDEMIEEDYREEDEEEEEENKEDDEDQEEDVIDID